MRYALLTTAVLSLIGLESHAEDRCCTPRGNTFYSGSSGDPKILNASTFTLLDEIQLDFDKVIVVCSQTKQIGVAIPIVAEKDGYAILITFPESGHAYRFTSPVLHQRPRSITWNNSDGLAIVTAAEKGFTGGQREYFIHINVDTDEWKPSLSSIIPYEFKNE